MVLLEINFYGISCCLGKDVAVFLNEVIQIRARRIQSGNSEITQEGHAQLDTWNAAASRIPLFLGGEDSLENMEVSDMEVYWDMTDQLWEAVKDLPEGTKIGNISFE